MDNQDLLNAEDKAPPLNLLLDSFVQDPQTFRNALDESGTIVIGPTVTSLLKGELMKTEELRLIGSWNALQSFLKILPSEGYQPSTQPSGVAFDRQVLSRKTSVLLECTDNPPCQYLIRTSMTTEDLCFMTGKYAVCICPKLTLDKKYIFLTYPDIDQRSTQLQGMNPQISKALNKPWVAISRRGYTLAEEHNYGSEIHGQRTIGDEHCLVMQIHEDGSMTEVPAEERQPSVMGFDSSSFSLQERIMR
jgi:hypothetical protein